MLTPLMPWLRRQQARYCYRRALTEISKGNLQAALQVLPQALDHHPRPAEIQVELGKVQWQSGCQEAALAHFTAAIALDPTCAKAYGNRGLLYCHQGQEDLALADWAIALRHHPHHALIHYNRGLLYLRQQHYDAALADFSQAIAANPNLAEAYLHRGHTYEQMGQPAAAAHDWALALCNDLNLDQARVKLHDLQQAERDRLLSDRLQAGLKLDQVAVMAHVKEGAVSIQLDRPVGVGINYFTLPEQIRALLISWQLDHIHSFDLTAQAQAVVEWQGHYQVFQGQPCPPARWHRVLLTAFVIFPPLGIPALACAINLRQAYQRGDYLTALRASKAIHGLCRAGGVISLTLALTVLGCWGYQRVSGSSKASAALPEMDLLLKELSPAAPRESPSETSPKATSPRPTAPADN